MDRFDQNIKNDDPGYTAQRRHRRRDNSSQPKINGETNAAEKAMNPGTGEGTAQTGPVTTAQGADSRVPLEARRMAAAPYGTARPEQKRLGTGTQMVSARRENPTGTETRSASVSPDLNKPHVRVGYAPGRMNERAELVSAGEKEETSQAYRNAKDYLEKHRKPFRSTVTGGNTPGRRGHRLMLMIVIVLMILGILVAGFLIMRGRNNRNHEDGNGVLSFEPTNTEGFTAPADVMFSVVTEKDIQQIRLKDEDGNTVDVTVDVADNAEGKAWLLTLHVENGFEETVRLEVNRTGDEWITTGYTAVVTVRSALVTQTPEPRPMSEATEGPSAEEEASGEETEEEVPAQNDEAQGEGEEAKGETETAKPQKEEEEEETQIREDSESDEEDEEIREAGELRTIVPTFTPAPQKEVPTVTPPLTAEAAPEANPDLIVSTAIYNGKKKEKEYSRQAKYMIHMPVADQYTNQNLGVMTFRGDNFRRNAAAGSLDGKATGIGKQWEVESGSSRGVNQSYYGYGWTGQPVIARWSKQVRAASNLYESKQAKEKLKEVIIAGLDGNIRFLDLDDGTLTRNSIKLGYPMRGTPSLHTRGAPFISVGQFARKMKVKTGSIGLRQYNLYTQKELKLIDGQDRKMGRALNNVGSFETSALVDRVSDTLITAGSNGMLYLEALDSTFDYNAGVLTVSPTITVMTSKAKGQKNPAMTAVESSLAAYDKYVFYADMGGVLRCVDTDILTPVWAVETGDSVMAAVALDLTEERELNLYTANMLNNRKKGENNIQIRRYDALSGRETWCTEIAVFKGKKDKDDVGAKASPVIGQKSLGSLVYFTVTGLSAEGRQSLGLSGEETAALIALDKETGKPVWTFGLNSRSESSPVAVYDPDGNGWIIQCEQNGTIHLLEGLTGQKTGSMKLDAEIEASPAVYNNTMVIGTTGKGTSFIYGIEIKTAVPEEGEESYGMPEETEKSGEPEEESEDEWEGPEEPEEAEKSGESEEESEEEWEEPDDSEEGENADEEVSGGA